MEDFSVYLGGEIYNPLSVHDANAAATFTQGADNLEALDMPDEFYDVPATIKEFRRIAEIYANRAVDFLGNQAG